MRRKGKIIMGVVGKDEKRNSWTVLAEGAGDGSGDVLVPLPDELLEEVGWEDGAELDMYVDEWTGSIILRLKG